MEISGAAIPTTPANTTVGIEVQKKTQEIQAQTAEALITAIPDPDSPKGQNVDVTA